MNRILGFTLAIICINAAAHEITTEQYRQLFKNYDACFILYDVKAHKIVTEYNTNQRCSERIAPDSTFKIPLSLMAFNDGIIKQTTLFKWHGERGGIPEHEQDQIPASWLKYSVVWVSQQLTPQLGLTRIQHYLAGFKYGNQDFSGDPGKNNGLTVAWLSSSLKISAMEQLQFLQGMLSNQLPVSHEAIANTKQNIYQGKLNNDADYYGKTGSGRHGRNERQTNPSKLREGWFIGFVEKGGQQYIFVSNLSDKVAPPDSDTAFGSQLLKPITITLLNDFFSSQANTQ